MANKKLQYTVEADVKGFQEGMQEAVYSTDQTEKAIQNLIDSTPALRKSFNLARKEAQDLANKFAQLSEVERNTAPGRYLAENLEFTEKRAAELQHTLNETNNRIKKLSEDGQYLDALNDGFTTVGSAASSVLGIIATATGNQEDFNRAIAAYTTIQSIANAITKIKNMIQKDSNVMVAIGNVQTKASKVATEANTAATVKGTIAQRAFNAVAKANPYVLLATAIIAITTAIAAYVVSTRKSTKAIDDNSKAIEKNKRISEAYGDKLSSTLTDTIGKFTLLQSQYKSLSDNASRVKWIKDNASEMESLGLSVRNVNDADKVFITQSEKVIEALQLRAEAAALEEQYRKALAEATQITPDPVGQENEGEFAIAPIDPTIYTSAMTKQVNKAYEPVLERIAELRKKAAEMMNIGGGSGNGNKPKTRLENLQSEVNIIKKMLENLDENAPDFEELRDNLLKSLENAEKKVKDYKIAIGIEKPKSEVEKYEEDLRKELKDADDAYKLAVKNDDKAAQEAAEQAYKVAQEKLDKLKIKIKAEIDRESINKDIESVMKSLQPDEHYNYDFSFLPDGYAEKAEDAQNRLNKLIDARKRLNEIAENNKDPETQARIQSELAKTDKEYQKLIKDVENFNQVSSKIKERENDFESFTNVVSSMNDVVGSIDGVVSSIQNLTKAFDEDTNGWEKFMAIWQTAMSVMQAVTTVMEIINTIQDIMNAKKAISGAVVAKEAAAQVALTTAQGTGIGTTTGFAAAQAAAIAPTLAMATALKQLAAAQIFAAHAYIPFAGPAIAAGYVEMMEGVMASIIAFAEGGIIPGGRSLHDNRLAMVESGEMVLNHRQQNNLFNAIDKNQLGTGSGSVEVTGIVRGKDLLLVQKNYNSISRKSGQQIHIG